ncbi:hypothetical protein AC249_AIPGENE21965 [Exaiptasia diaphana]|nr:hypothetical protein AC249_AIPGENE21965 [Exaiptasia diaphana]
MLLMLYWRGFGSLPIRTDIANISCFKVQIAGDSKTMNKSVIVVMLAVLVASVMVQTGDAFLRNGRDSIPAKRENALADEFFNEYLRERFPVDDRFKKRRFAKDMA